MGGGGGGRVGGGGAEGPAWDKQLQIPVMHLDLASYARARVGTMGSGHVVTMKKKTVGSAPTDGGGGPTDGGGTGRFLTDKRGNLSTKSRPESDAFREKSRCRK